MPSHNYPNLQALPVGTLYASDGMLNLNGEAARLLPPQMVGVRLLSPSELTAPYWLLLPTYAGEPTDAKLYAQTPRHCTLRLRAAALATALFACLPPNQAQLRLQLVPTDTLAYQLLPLS
jgi:hypothetical protein